LTVFQRSALRREFVDLKVINSEREREREREGEREREKERETTA